MIDPKYADLPGIAYDQPDVYETNEVLQENTTNDHTEDTNDAVEKLNLNASDAFNQFKDKYLNSFGADFSNTLSPNLKIGYESCGTQWNRSSITSDEIPIQKYQRLKREITELLEQLNVFKNSSSEKKLEMEFVTNILHEMENAQQELQTVDVKNLLTQDSLITLTSYQEIYLKELESQIEVLKQKKEVTDNTSNSQVTDSKEEVTNHGLIKYKMFYYPEKTKQENISKLCFLEQRVGKLENILGSSYGIKKPSQVLKSEGIIRSIEKLMANACLLKSSQLDMIENKTSSLLYKLDNVSQKKSAVANHLNSEAKILELYTLMKAAENCFSTLPQTLDRLLTLSAVHQKAAEFTHQLNGLEALKNKIDGSIINNITLLEEMKKNFNGNLQTISNDIKSLNERVKNLKYN